MIASFFAAFMSTLSTYLNLSSAYFVNDFYRPFIKKDAGDRHYILVSRIMMVVLSFVTAIATYYVNSIVGVFKFLIAFGSGTGLVYIVRWFWWRVNAWSEISAMVASTVMSVVAYTTYAGSPFYWKLMLIISVSTAVWITVTYLTPPVSMEKLEAFVRHVNPGGPGWRTVRNGRELMPEAEGLTGPLFEWAYGSLFLIGLTLGTGKFLLGYHASAGIWGGISLITGWLMYRSFSNRGSRLLA
jgi:Na+/proline symporter